MTSLENPIEKPKNNEAVESEKEVTVKEISTRRYGGNGN